MTMGDMVHTGKAEVSVTTDKGKTMQFIKEVGGRFIAGAVLILCGFLWGTAENKGAALNQIATNTSEIAVLKTDVKELQLLRVDISDLRGDIKALNATLQRRGLR